VLVVVFLEESEAVDKSVRGIVNQKGTENCEPCLRGVLVLFEGAKLGIRRAVGVSTLSSTNAILFGHFEETRSLIPKTERKSSGSLFMKWKVNDCDGSICTSFSIFLAPDMCNICIKNPLVSCIL
jgi:hypothetical protein